VGITAGSREEPVRSGGNHHRWFKRRTSKKRWESPLVQEKYQSEAVGITAGSREVPVRSGGKSRWFKRRTRKKRPVTRDSNNNNNNNNNNHDSVGLCHLESTKQQW
jgi:hypothetical protein